MSSVLKEKEIMSFVDRFPNSVIADLVMHFDRKIVIELIELYSGKSLDIPSVKSVWISYRNSVIKKALDKKNSKKERERLAENFGLIPSTIAQIYQDSKRTGATVVKDRTIKRVVDTIFRKNSRKYFKRHKEIYNFSASSKDNPETIYLTVENKQVFLEECISDIERHLIFSDRVPAREIAIKMLVHKLRDEK